MAMRVGFEPTEPVKAQRFSSSIGPVRPVLPYATVFGFSTTYSTLVNTRRNQTRRPSPVLFDGFVCRMFATLRALCRQTVRRPMLGDGVSANGRQ